MSMCVIHIQVRVENGTVCAIAGSDAFLINTMDHGEWTSSFTVLGRVELDDAESWAAIRSIIDQPWYDTYQKSLIHLQMMRNATHIHWKWNRAHRHHSLSVLSCFFFLSVPRSEFVHPDYGTHMRMLTTEIEFTVSSSDST